METTITETAEDFARFANTVEVGIEREGKPYRVGFPIESGVSRIAVERARQFVVHDYDGTHDDRHDRGELVRGAIAYLLAGTEPQGRLSGATPHQVWPWDRGNGWSPEADILANLTKAGAMIAAEIDRLVRHRDAIEATRPMTVRKDDLDALLAVARAAVRGHVAPTTSALADALDRVGMVLEGERT